jgi:hypothetical protein
MDLFIIIAKWLEFSFINFISTANKGSIKKGDATAIKE